MIKKNSGQSAKGSSQNYKVLKRDNSGVLGDDLIQRIDSLSPTKHNIDRALGLPSSGMSSPKLSIKNKPSGKHLKLQYSPPIEKKSTSREPGSPKQKYLNSPNR